MFIPRLYGKSDTPYPEEKDILRGYLILIGVLQIQNMGRPTDVMLRQRYKALLDGDPILAVDGQSILTNPKERLYELRRMVILNGLPKETEEEKRQSSDLPCSLRGCVWKLLLGVTTLDAERYACIVRYGASRFDEDIRNDTFRTFTNDSEFARRVPEEQLARLLNAFVHELTPDETQSKYRYVQGMNILSAPLLYVMPEVDAYYAFRKLIMEHCPRYVASHLEGVHAGCHLVDECLQVVDPELYDHLFKCGITATIYAFPLVLSLFACAPPLQELLRVWDVLLAVGVHFNVILCIAHITLLRDKLLSNSTPMHLMRILQLREIPPLDSNLLLSVAFALFHRMPDELLYKVARHTLDDPDNQFPNVSLLGIASPSKRSTKIRSPSPRRDVRKRPSRQIHIDNRPPWRY